MKVAITGATGMVGSGVLHECLSSSETSSVLAVGRRPTGLEHPKLIEIEQADFHDFSDAGAWMKDIDALLWCLGISSAGMSEERYTEITVDYARAAVEALQAHNPQARFIFLSGAGADESEKGRSMWARVKGVAENLVLSAGFRSATIFRPGMILHQVGSGPRGLMQRAGYYAFLPFYLPTRALGGATSQRDIGRAMIEAAAGRVSESRLNSKQINRISKQARAQTS